MKINYKDYYYKYKALKYYLKNNNIEIIHGGNAVQETPVVEFKKINILSKKKDKIIKVLEHIKKHFVESFDIKSVVYKTDTDQSTITKQKEKR